MVKIVLNQDDCNGLEACGECIDTCPLEIFKPYGDKIVIEHPDECIICEACVDICPNQCISVKSD
ncbi:MAG: 4Fe-4S binding protein [Methanobrevibacter sp.]|jgi:NAD-dependent dihydropyrimidine dehydrogenase PreA subunit|nr:4Fe-4S binding protein [Methanobrevibacter sp.]